MKNIKKLDNIRNIVLFFAMVFCILSAIVDDNMKLLFGIIGISTIVIANILNIIYVVKNKKLNNKK